MWEFLSPLSSIIKIVGVKFFSYLFFISVFILTFAFLYFDEATVLVMLTVISVFCVVTLLSFLQSFISSLSQILDNVASRNSDSRLNGFSQQLVSELEKPYLKLIRSISIKEDGFKNLLSEMEHSAKELTETAKKLAQNTSIQSNSTTSSAAAVTQVSQSIEEVSARINETNNLATSAKQLGEKSRVAIVQSRQEVEQVSVFAEQTSEQVKSLEMRSVEVSNITKVIEEIAEKTNLLALNAAIEAARAGENGRGFAVVADEVRALASQSLRSASEISSNISSVNENMMRVAESMGGVMQRVESCIQSSTVAEQQLVALAEKNDQVFQEVEAVLISASQQAEATREISQHIEEVAVAADQNHYMAEQTAAVSTHLYELTRQGAPS